MKAIILPTIVTVSAQAGMPSLANLRNHTLLSAAQEVGPLESIAHIATFDEIPIFGGVELREKMLEQAHQAIETNVFDLFTTNVVNTVSRATKALGCGTLGLIKGASKLEYSHYCEEIPTKSLRSGSDLESALQ